MAVMRYRKHIFICLLVMSLVSMIILLTLLPQKDDMLFPGQLKRFDLQTEPRKVESVTRRYVKKVSGFNPQEVLVMNVLAAPQLQSDSQNQDRPNKGTAVEGKVEENKLTENDRKDDKDTKLEGSKKVENDQKDDKKDSKVEERKKVDSDQKKLEKTTISLLKNKTYELGIKVQNKTVEAEEKMKNKTLENLVLIGVDNAKGKPFPQLVFVPEKWNLTVSFEDIGDVMKDTKFLNKVDPLNLDGPILVSSRNRTANYTYTMPLKFGYCDCFERYCVCCAALTNKRLHLNATACSNFTFVSKSHELDLKFYMDGRLIHKAIISANKSPMLCLGSVPKVADVCVHFFNMTFRVNEHNAAQTQLLGCTDLSLNLYNRTLGAFPIDCFQIPGDPNKVHRERNFNIGFNWMP